MTKFQTLDPFVSCFESIYAHTLIIHLFLFSHNRLRRRKGIEVGVLGDDHDERKGWRRSGVHTCGPTPTNQYSLGRLGRMGRRELIRPSFWFCDIFNWFCHVTREERVCHVLTRRHIKAPGAI